MKVTPDQIVRVAEQHIKLYENRIEHGRQGSRHVNVKDCEHYLKIWKGIKAKGGENLNAVELGEVVDAFHSGDYDKIFKETN